MVRRSYAGAAPVTELAAGITAGSSSFTVVSGGGSGYPTGSNGPFFVVLDETTANEEKILCSDRTGDVFTVAGGGRGADDTSAVGHTQPCTVRHVYTATDADEANQHVNTDAGVHGTSSAIVGRTDSQTLENKEIDGNDNTFANIAQSAVIDLVGDQATQDSDIAQNTSDISQNASDLTDHENATEAHGATGAVVGTTNSQTLMNKVINPEDNTTYGWVPIGGRVTISGQNNASITVPSGFEALRLIIRGSVSGTVANIGMRINGDSGDYSWRLAGIDNNTEEGDSANGTIPRIARFGSNVAALAVVEIDGVGSDGLNVSWVARNGRALLGSDGGRLYAAYGRTNGVVGVNSLFISNSEDEDFGTTTFYRLEGFRAP